MLNPTAGLLQKVDAICRRDVRYKPESYLFVLAGLHFTVTHLPEPRHISGQELSEGLRLYGLGQFGPLARQVFQHWGVHATEDFGRIVFNLVNAKLLRKREEDVPEDFRGVYDFAEALDPQPLYKLADESS